MKSKKHRSKPIAPSRKPMAIPPLLVTFEDRNGRITRTVELTDPRVYFCKFFNELNGPETCYPV